MPGRSAGSDGDGSASCMRLQSGCCIRESSALAAAQCLRSCRVASRCTKQDCELLHAVKVNRWFPRTAIPAAEVNIWPRPVAAQGLQHTKRLLRRNGWLGETLDEATRREWAEEVGIAFNVEGPFKEFQHVRGFYCDDRDEFWIYDQTFRLYHFLGDVNSGEKWLNSEGGTSGWEAISTLPQLSINRAHWCAIPTLLAGLPQS